MHTVYYPQGVCSRAIEFELDGDIIKTLQFTGGCSGNLQGVAALAVGQNAYDVIDLLEGIQCGMKSTSCPDQLSKALRQALGKR